MKLCGCKGTCLDYHVVCSVRNNTEIELNALENIALKSSIEHLQDENAALQSRIQKLESNLNEKEEAIKNLKPAEMKTKELEADCIRLQAQIAGFQSHWLFCFFPFC